MRSEHSSQHRSRSYASEQYHQKVRQVMARATEFSRDVETKKVLDTTSIRELTNRARADYDELQADVLVRYWHFETIANQLDDSERQEIETAHAKLTTAMENAYKGLLTFLGYEKFLNSAETKRWMDRARSVLMLEIPHEVGSKGAHKHEFRDNLTPERFMAFKTAIRQLNRLYRTELAKEPLIAGKGKNAELPVDFLWNILGEHQVLKTEERLRSLNNVNNGEDGLYSPKGEQAGGDFWLDRSFSERGGGSSVGEVCVDIRDHGDWVGGMKTVVEALLRSLSSIDSDKMFSILHEFVYKLGVKQNTCSLVDVRINRSEIDSNIKIKIAGDTPVMVLDKGKLRIIHKGGENFHSPCIEAENHQESYMHGVGSPMFEMTKNKMKKDQAHKEPEIEIVASKDAWVLVGTDGVSDLFREFLTEEEGSKRNLLTLAEFCDEHSPDNKEGFIKALIKYIKDQTKTDDVTLKVLR